MFNEALPAGDFSLGVEQKIAKDAKKRQAVCPDG
jgi:hypothetical protein